jgi:hypothetical protein
MIISASCSTSTSRIYSLLDLVKLLFNTAISTRGAPLKSAYHTCISRPVPTNLYGTVYTFTELLATSSIYWSQQSRCSCLPDDGDRLQSPKRRVFLIEDRRWIMSKKFVILTTHHRHKPSELTRC